MLEMKNEWPSFEVFEGNKEVLLIVYALIRYNVIWNVKLVYPSLTYSYIVSRESMRLNFTIAALNKLDILAYAISIFLLDGKV